jgi:hypothetical protein
MVDAKGKENKNQAAASDLYTQLQGLCKLITLFNCNPLCVRHWPDKFSHLKFPFQAAKDEWSNEVDPVDCITKQCSPIIGWFSQSEGINSSGYKGMEIVDLLPYSIIHLRSASLKLHLSACRFAHRDRILERI